MARYALVDKEGKNTGIIEWDGKSSYTPPEDMELVSESEAPPYEPVESAREISALAFFNRFTAEEQVKVMAACSSAPALYVGLINGLASGSVTLDSEKMNAWLDGMVTAKAITAKRRTEIQTS